jgi:sulfopyruvate decarboxylase beta subunit
LPDAEDRLIGILRDAGVDFVSSLPCEKVRLLIEKASGPAGPGLHVDLTREEEGVGISAGAALAGRRPAMIIQSSGFGNMVNALLSLTGYYGLPLALFISHRGVYREKIEAQVPMGRALPALLRAAGIGYTVLRRPPDLSKVEAPLRRLYEKGRTHAFLLSPSLWEPCAEGGGGSPHVAQPSRRPSPSSLPLKRPPARFTRYEVIRILAPVLRGNAVVSNIGVPSKELFSILEQPSNFYMLGSMGMATPVGLGVALSSGGKVFVIDGDGSLLMNPGTLATVARQAPPNLTVLAIDNGVYGSTGGQPTHAAWGADLSVVARGFGVSSVFQASSERDILAACRSRARGPRFVHILALPGNARVPNIPLEAGEIRAQFTRALAQ